MFLPGLDDMKTEVLGYGQQCVVDGVHASGEQLVWPFTSPLAMHRDDLPAVTERRIQAMLEEIVPLIGVDIVQQQQQQQQQQQAERERAERVTTADIAHAAPYLGDVRIDDLASAIAVMPADDGYDTRLMVLAALYNATHGSAEGLDLAHTYSKKSVRYNRKSVDKKWRSFRSSPMPNISAGTIFHMARTADPSWISPSYREKSSHPPYDRLAWTEDTGAKTGEDIGSSIAQDDLFPVLTVAQAKALPPPKWLIPNLIVENSLTVLYAPSANMKSFLTVDIAMRLAYGQPWLGKPMDKRPVAYVAAEGHAGMGKRIHAWERHHGLLDADNLLALIPATVNLLEPEQVDRFIRTIRKVEDTHGHRFALVVIDTLARSMVGGDENGPEDMSRAVAGAGQIQATLIDPAWAILEASRIAPSWEHEARGHAEVGGGGARGAPTAGDRLAPGRDDLRRDCGAGRADPDWSV